VSPIASCPIFNCPIKYTSKRMVPLVAPKSDCNQAWMRHGTNADAKIKTSDPCQKGVSSPNSSAGLVGPLNLEGQSTRGRIINTMCFPLQNHSITFTMSTSIVIVTAILASLSLFLVKHVLRPQKPPLPPGPKGLPLLGNIRDLPPPGTLEWPHWQSHKEKYGPITSVSVLGQNFVILHDRQVIMDLLETRAMKSASRPKLVFAGDM
jgi:hypothetical protein